MRDAALTDSVSNIGTFACRTFPRDTKASEIANRSSILKGFEINIVTFWCFDGNGSNQF
jgi:hypothetical protein